MVCICPPRRTVQHSVLSTHTYFTQRRTLITPRRTVHLGVIYTEVHCPSRRTLHQGVVSTKAHCPPRRTLHQGVLSTYTYFTPRHTLHRGVLYTEAYFIPRRTVHRGVLYTVEGTGLKQGIYLSTKAYCTSAASFPPEARMPVSSDRNSAAVVLEEKGFTCRYSACSVGQGRKAVLLVTATHSIALAVPMTLFKIQCNDSASVRVIPSPTERTLSVTKED